MLVSVDALADSEENEREPQLPKEKRGTQAQCIEYGINDTNLLIAGVKVALHMNRIKHLGHRA